MKIFPLKRRLVLEVVLLALVLGWGWQIYERKVRLARLEARGVGFDNWVFISPAVTSFLVSKGLQSSDETLKKFPLSRSTRMVVSLPVNDVPQLVADLKEMRGFNSVSVMPWFTTQDLADSAISLTNPPDTRWYAPQSQIMQFGLRELPDELLEALVSRPELRELSLSNADVSAHGWQTIGRSSRISTLMLDAVRFDDHDCAALRPMSGLRHLSLQETFNTEACLGVLGEMKGLQSVRCFGLPFSEDGEDQLKRLLPSARILIVLPRR